jgi:hypothetical protein
MARAPTNEQIVTLLERVLSELTELKSDVAKLTKTA